MLASNSSLELGHILRAPPTAVLLTSIVANTITPLPRLDTNAFTRPSTSSSVPEASWNAICSRIQVRKRLGRATSSDRRDARQIGIAKIDMAGVFISYRRSDSDVAAGRL